MIATAQPLLCDPEPPGSDPRPIWAELSPPGGSGYPDYQNVSSNLKVLDSIRLLASLLTRAAESLQGLQSQVEDPEAIGNCVCCISLSCAIPGEIHPNTLRKDCTAANKCTDTEGPDYPLWLPTDLFESPENSARFTLEYIGLLDDINNVIGQIAQALTAAGSGLQNAGDLATVYAHRVDVLSEGFHLGGYSTERPDLHLCVGYGGHGAFAEMVNLFGEVTIGSRYTSHSLSAEHRAQFRSGGFAVNAFGHVLSILPGIEANLQIDGFKLWNASKPFGVDLGLVGDPLCADGPGFRLADIDKYDVFHLLDTDTDLKPFDSPQGFGDGCLQPGEFVIKDYYPAHYLSGASPLVWPRPGVPYDWEKQNTALFSAGLNLPLEMTKIEKLIPPTGVVVIPGVAIMFPKLTLNAGAEWTHQANGLRTRLQDAVNKHLAPSAQLDAGDFERPMHFLQAPDVSEDDGSSAYVRPRVAADLVVGFTLSRYLLMGITASLGLSVRVEPAAHGGLHDLNVALATALLNSNPPPDLPCDPIIEVTEKTECSNTLLGGSEETYTCDTDQATIFHCKAPEQATMCRPATAERDCPETGQCVAEHGCSAHGYCERLFGPGPDRIEWTGDDDIAVEHDTTYDACFGNAVCDDAAVNAGAACDKDEDCVGPSRCEGGSNAGNPCMAGRDCPDGACQSIAVACVQFSPIGYFTPYQCLVHDQPAITGWQGPGCHPLTVGFPSACGCASDADCVAGVETCAAGACTANAQVVPCTCDPGAPSCPSGRICRDGACVLDCSVNGGADCAADQTCQNGACANSYGIPFGEQLVWQIAHTPKPQHAVATYGLSDILTSAILDAGLFIGLDLRFARKVYHFKLLELSDYWTLAAFNKSWYQPGLEARYQNDCDPVTGNTVSNWQPGALRVSRYNPAGAPVGAYGNAGTLGDLEQWCAAELPGAISDPVAPSGGDLSGSAQDILEWGEAIATDVWALGALCVTRDTGHGVVSSTPLSDYLTGLHANPGATPCTYTFNNQTYVFPCGDLREQLLNVWGCLDTDASAVAALLAAGFPSFLTTFGTQPVFDLDDVLIDPGAEFTLDNIKPAFRSYGLNAGHLWFQAVTQCFEQHHAVLMPGDLQLGGVQLGPCCGNRVLDTAGCPQGPGVPPCESCDDGNTIGGDGCSALCRIEGRPFPLGICGNGIVERQDLEQCDDGNTVAGDGCEPDCTLTQGEPRPTRTRPPPNTPTATATRRIRRCVGDCDRVGGVGIAELVTGVNIALGQRPLSACQSFDDNGDLSVSVNELVLAVASALEGCETL